MSFAYLQVEYYNLNRTRWIEIRVHKGVKEIDITFHSIPQLVTCFAPNADDPSELREAAELMAEHFNDLDGVESYFEILTALSGAI